MSISKSKEIKDILINFLYINMNKQIITSKSKIKTTPITEKEKMTGNIQLIDMLNQGVELKPEELMDVSNFLIESRRAYDPAINYSDSRAPFIDKNKIFEDKRKELLKQKAESAASEYIQKNQDQLYDLAVKKYRQEHHIKNGDVFIITFGEVKEPAIIITDEDTDEILCRYDIKDNFAEETALEAGQIIISDEGEWTFEPLGKGYTGGIKTLATIYE